jgi:hypothetical protein
MLDQVTAALTAMKPAGAFAAEFTTGSGDLHLEVKGVGPIRFPISAATAKKLCKIARPAPFGRRDETLTDLSVRNTWQIGKSLVKIDARSWQRTLVPALARVRKRLGMPESGQLTAAFDKMLVYEPGQFFAPHQDSERADDMVGTLVVQLPSTGTGGAVVVQHHDQKKVFRGAKRGPKDLSLLAFYADCHHEVRPIKSGYRVVLTYHLHYQEAAGGGEGEAGHADAHIERLAKSVKAYFDTPVAPRYSLTAPQRPDRLIYLLDHEYSQKSLAWDRLKNGDRRRVSALRQVAERLDCEIFLALADVHENWSCIEDWDEGYGRRGWYRWREEEEEEEEQSEESADYRLDELLDADVELRHFIGPDGRAARDITVVPSMQEVCFTRASVDMDPFQSEHEGYMGNYGNTVDRWYHRAALVMWPRERNFLIRAKQSPAWAVKQLAARVKSRAVDEARDMARSLLPFWPTAARTEPGPAFFSNLLAVLASLDDAELSYELLRPLGYGRLSPSTIPAFVNLIERHGGPWAQRLFTTWSEQRNRWAADSWLPILPRLCEALAGSPAGKEVGTWLLDREVKSFLAECMALRNAEIWSQGGLDTKRQDDVLALLEAAAVLQAAPIREELIAALLDKETGLPLMSAGKLLRKSRRGRSPAEVKALGLAALYQTVVSALEEILRAPERDASDWSIEPPMTCRCDLCKTLSAFLRDRTLIKTVWPLAQQGRAHVHQMIDHHRLPVKHETTRSGRPYSLVLTKQEALFKRAADLRKEQQDLLGWLNEERAAFI